MFLGLALTLLEPPFSIPRLQSKRSQERWAANPLLAARWMTGNGVLNGRGTLTSLQCSLRGPPSFPSPVCASSGAGRPTE